MYMTLLGPFAYLLYLVFKPSYPPLGELSVLNVGLDRCGTGGGHLLEDVTDAQMLHDGGGSHQVLVGSHATGMRVSTESTGVISMWSNHQKLGRLPRQSRGLSRPSRSQQHMCASSRACYN